MSEASLKPDDLPSTWALTSLGAVVDYGCTTKAEPSQISDEDWVLELEDIEKESSRLLQRITFAQRRSKSTKSRFKAGDVLYGKLRPYLNKVLIADRAGYCTTEIVPIETGAQLDKRYLFYWLKHPAFLKYVEAESHGMNMPRLGRDTAKAAPFVLAPRNEQTRIADQLDKLLARAQACNDRINAIPALLKRFRQAVWEAATSGTLTANWRAGIDAVFPWNIVHLADVIADMRNGLAPKPNKGPPGTKILRIGAVRSGRLDLSDHRYLMLDVKELDIYRLETDDLLFTRYNGSLEFVGVCARVREMPEDYVYPDKLIRVRCNITDALPAFIEFAFATHSVRSQIEACVKSSAGQKGISGGSLKEIQFAIPGIEEQAEIVRRTEALLKLADRIEARYTAARAQAQRLTPRLLAKAFRGELVPQDPNDEPTSELLDHLVNTETERAVARKRSPKKKEMGSMNKKTVMPVIDALRAANRPLTATALLAEAGYPADASTELVERFFLDIRNELDSRRIERVRRGTDDFFSLVQ